MTEVTLRIRRFDPATSSESRVDGFEVPWAENMRILEGLDFIRESLGVDLGYEWYCGVKKCGMCGVRASGRSVLACMEPLTDGMLLEPLPGFPVVRDLVIDRSRYEHDVDHLNPILQRGRSYAGYPEPLVPSDFDEMESTTNCIECQICTSVCPAYALSDRFMGPAAIVQLARVALDPRDAGGREESVATAGLDDCLGCMACSSACPTDVPYEHLLTPLRALANEAADRPVGERLVRSTANHVLTKPRRLRWAMRARALAKWLPLPQRLRAMAALAPSTSSSSASLPAFSKATRSRQGVVGLVRGCVQDAVFGKVNEATVRVLTADGFDVATPPQECCGALALHSGKVEDGLNLAKKMIESFEGIEADLIVTNAAGCGSHLKDVGRMLRGDPAFAERAATFSNRIRDISEVVASTADPATRHPLAVKVAYQDPCHLLNAQGIREAPREMLDAIPDLRLLDVPEQDVCCGSAGIYNLVRPREAQELGQRKARNIEGCAPDLYSSSNPGCLLQVGAALRADGHPLPACHPIEIVDASIRNRGVEAMVGSPPQR